MAGLVVGPIRPPKGAALRGISREPGRLAEMVATKSQEQGPFILATEVPVPGGIADLVFIRLTTDSASSGLHDQIGTLSPLEDRRLLLLSELQLGRRYLRRTLLAKGWVNRDVDLLHASGLLASSRGAFQRVRLLPDEMKSVTSYELKISDVTTVVLQAARRRLVADRTFVAMPSPRPDSWPDRAKAILASAGVGVFDLDRHSPVRPSRLVRTSAQARFLMARAILRGITH